MNKFENYYLPSLLLFTSLTGCVTSESNNTKLPVGKNRKPLNVVFILSDDHQYDYWEYEFPQTPTMQGVRTDHYKYIRYYGIWDTNEFYDLKEDPLGMNNLIASLDHQDI
jgi:hypothetical protein